MGLKVSASMSSDPLVSIEHATPTGQDSIRIWEGRKKSGGGKTLSPPTSMLYPRMEGVQKAGLR